jgi:hypothetical protein
MRTGKKEHMIRRDTMKQPYESNRKYSVDFMKKYLDALVKHDTKAVSYGTKSGWE